MASPVNQLGRPPDVTALIVSKETNVTSVQKGSRVMTVISVPRGSRETIASIVPPDSRVMDAGNVQWTTTEIIAVKILNCFYYYYFRTLSGFEKSP